MAEATGDAAAPQPLERDPVIEAYKKDIPNLLVQLGFSKEKAEFLAGNIVVDPARGSGHAMGAARRGDQVHLRTRVQRIEWSNEGVQVHAEGPDGPETREAAAAVVTVSLGVLRARVLAFDPPLPGEKQKAIDAIGWGHANKALLVFDPSLGKTVLGKATSIAGADGSWFLLPYHGEPGSPIVLEGFLAGRRARSLAGLPETEAVDAIVADLEAKTRIPNLRSHLLAARFVDWTSDPDVRGGYTFPGIGGGLTQRKILAEALDGVLFFAGEATHYAGDYATVHGALESGERAAKEVLAAFRERGHAPSEG